MANEKNLKPLNQRTQRERKEIARMGAEASNKVQANKKVLREAAKAILSMPVDGKIKEELKLYNLKKADCTFAMAIVVAQIKNALQGNTGAFNAIRDIIGEKPNPNEAEAVTDDEKNIVINIIPASEADIEKDD